MNKQLAKQQIDVIMASLNRMVTEGPWEASPFLREIGRKIAELKEGFSANTTSEKNDISNESMETRRERALTEGRQEVFVALYSADGSNMNAWERILMNLPRQLISRPIYASEEDVKAAIRAKGNTANEAYVSIFIDASSILTLHPDRVARDKLGKPLLTLKDRVLTLDAIDCFVHLSKTYYFKGSKLIDAQMS